MKIERNLLNSPSRREIINRARKSFRPTGGVGRRFRPLIGFVLCSIGVLLALAGLSQSVAATPATGDNADTLGSWEATGSMITGRLLYTATLLPTGKVL